MAEPVPLRSRRTSFIERFVELTEGIECPLIFRKWAAVTCVSGALERKTWSVTWGKLFPNLFVILTANPGIGKTVAIEMVHRLWTQVSSASLNVAPTTVTKAGLIDHYAEQGLRTVPGVLDVFSSCLVPARELGHMVTEFDLPFLNTLNDFFDCNEVPYIERTRGKGKIKLQEPHMVLLAGTQPTWLSSVLPESAYSLGTMSRTILVYSDEFVGAPLWQDLTDDIVAVPNPVKDRAIKILLPDLDRIASMYGCFMWTGQAKRLVDAWRKEGFPPIPQHHRLRHYATRRLVFVLKLCMIMSAAEDNSLTIHQHHVEEAMRLLFEAEGLMPEIFKEMSSAGSQSAIINDFLQWMLILHAKRGQKPIPEHRMWEFLRSRLPASQIKPTIDALIRSNLIKEIKVPNRFSQTRMFVPIRPNEAVEDE